MQLSIDEFNQEAERRGRSGGAEGTRGEGAVRVFTQFAVVIKQLRVFVWQAFERVRNAQARASKQKQMRLLETLALGNRRQILLVAYDNQRYLVGVGPDSVGSILAMEEREGVQELSAKGPELVRRRGRDAKLDANVEARSKAAAEAGFELWQ